MFSAVSRLFKISETVAVFAAAGPVILSAEFSDTEIAFESLESRTRDGAPVYNRIRFERRGDLDVWLMRQSHQGPELPAHRWDRLAIVVDRSRVPKTARYYQLEPGPLEWSAGAREVPFRAACFMCHNNGPRRIRPDAGSRDFALGLRERLTLEFWNLRMKSYGRVVVSPEQETSAPGHGSPFRYGGAFDNQVLSLGACVKCHNEEGGRGALRRQQAGTIQFMVERGFMPLRGELSIPERERLDRFLSGLSVEEPES